MTPTEVTTILRQFNKWLRGNKEGPQLESREIGKAIDAAVEMIDRLELAEKERDALQAKIEQMEKQGPVGQFIQHPSNGLWEQDGYGDNPDARPLYALPGVKGE